MKSQTKKVFLGAATLAALTAVDRQAHAVTAVIDLQARIVTSAALLLTATQALQFGAMLSGGTGGKLSVLTNGGTAKVGSISPVGASIQPGGFKIKGSNGKSADFSMPALATLKNTAASSKVMTVDSFKIGLSSKAPGSFTIGLTGSFQSGVPVGGRLIIGAGQATGNYTGTGNIITNYQ